MKQLKLSLEKKSAQRERIATRLVAAFVSVPDRLCGEVIIRESVNLAKSLVNKLEEADAKDFEERYS